MSPGWPAVLRDGDLVLRPLCRSDAKVWSEVRLANREWLHPWEATPAGHWTERSTPAAFRQLLRQLRRQARAGTTMPFAMVVEGRLLGQVTIGNIVRGSYNGGYLGYWVDQRQAGRGITPRAVALVVDHAFREGRLHRLEANIRPENVASRRVVEKLGFREEGLHRRYLFIDGAYRDHTNFAVTVEDVPDGMLARLRAQRHDDLT